MKTLLTIVFCCAADFVISREFLSVWTSQRIWNSIALWGGAATLMGLPFVHSNAAAVVLLVSSLGCGAGIYPGYVSNHLDLAPNFAGLLLGITNGLGNISSILAPLVAGFVVTDETSKEQWMVIFYICAATFFFGNLAFLMFGSAEVQPWNNTLEDIDKSPDEENLSTQDDDIRDRRLAKVIYSRLSEVSDCVYHVSLLHLRFADICCTQARGFCLATATMATWPGTPTRVNSLTHHSQLEASSCPQLLWQLVLAHLLESTVSYITPSKRLPAAHSYYGNLAWPTY
ncbi:hypothetical protein J6590_077430 [Homalodisca vitripennis]|nr:hypothetical protein J6590_077430 [Homalodisca vitripennis]